MYGASLIGQSYTILYVSLFAHICQLFFLNLVETPHIKKVRLVPLGFAALPLQALLLYVVEQVNSSAAS
jgi:hypothetical protein